MSSGRASTDIGGSTSPCAMPCSSQYPKCPVKMITPLPAARALRTRSSPSNSTRARICSGLSVLNRSTATSSRPKCANVARAIARHSAASRVGKAARSWLIASRRCAPIDGVEREADERAQRPRDRVRQQPHDAADGRDEGIFDAVPDRGLLHARASRIRSRSQARNASAGSTDTSSGTAATGTAAGETAAAAPRPFQS